MQTGRQAKAERAALLREVEREERAQAKAKLSDLRAELARARVAKKGAMGLARARCIAERKSLRHRAKQRRERLIAELRQAVAIEKFAAREACDRDVSAARELVDRAAGKRAALEHERAFRRQMRVIERNAREREQHVKRRRTRKEAAAESDEEVEGNVSSELVPLWRRVKAGIRGTARMSRTEAFLHYAQEHPGEILEALQDRTDVLVRELEARYAAAAG
jgi:hypothetical protein